MSHLSQTPEYVTLLKDLKDRIRSAQYEALKTVNQEMIGLYWDIGKKIVEQQKENKWGKSIVVNLANDLRLEFPGVQGFSDRNIWNMRNFYVLYSQNQKLQPLVAEISWAKHLVIMSGCKNDLERGLITKVNKFLVEMGGAFAFMGNQFRLEVDGDEYFIDILLYHRRLKCLIAVELKVGKFRPEHVGKMQFYLVALDDTIRQKGENPSIGIILCKDKGRTTVEYALRVSKKPIAVAQYKISQTLPKDLQKELPAPQQIQALLDGIAKPELKR